VLSRAVDLIRERFNFYHAGIFLTDASNEYAVLQAATGEAGRAMLDRKHKLKIGEVGMVGRVVANGQPLISLDVGTETAHFKNPLLPDTRSEMTLPLKVGNQIIGALDVQSTESSAFGQEDIDVLQTMADQLAVAIDSARSYQEARESLRQLEELYGRISKEAWERIGRTEQILGYQYEPTGTEPIYRHEILSMADSEKSPITIPLKVREQVIGSLDIWPEGTKLSAEEQVFLQGIGERISQALESARLFEEAQNRALREQTLSQLTAHFTRSVGLETLLRTAVQELGRMPNVTEVSIHLGNEGPKGENGKDRQAIYG
jgi:GAF domain-containing protein